MSRTVFVALALALAATPVLAASNVQVEVIDASTLRISTPPKAGVKLNKMRNALMRAASEETLRRGYEWFDLAQVEDTSRERDFSNLQVNFPASSAGSSPTGQTLVVGETFQKFSGGPLTVIEPGAVATIRMGNGPRPDVETAVDARAMLTSLR